MIAISGYYTATVLECDGDKGRTILNGHTGYLSSVAFSPDGKQILTGSWDMTARLWESCSGKLLAILQGHTVIVCSVAFSPDERLALTSDVSGWTFFWDIERSDKPRCLGLSVTTDRVSSVFWQDATHLLLADCGAGSGQPGVYRLCWQGECWQPGG